MRPIGAVAAEAWRSARAQRVTSLVVAGLVAAVCLGVLLTAGRTVAAEEQVLSRIDAAGTRSIIVRAPADSPVPASVVDLLSQVREVEEVTGLGPLMDTQNSLVPGAPPVPVRPAYGGIAGTPMVPELLRATAIEEGWASETAAAALGLVDGTGGVRSPQGMGLSVRWGLEVPPRLRLAEPLVVIPSSTAQRPSGTDPSAPLTLLVVVTDTPQDVASVTDLVTRLVRADNPGQVVVETSQELADSRAAVSGQLGEYGRSTILGALGLGIVLLGSALLALMNGRRKDFGRRRALGASHSLIVTLVLVQVAIPAVGGVAIGIGGALGWLAADRQPLPGTTFTVAVALAALVATVVAATVPALVAARRDPLHELRVP